MFYSHEILASPRNGVSTIWLAATVGPRSGTRKITKKAIQDVNIPRACLTIIDPGAPIALRLQGNLLYGVSRVFSQQCAYMLGDTEKVQAHMQTFYRLWGTNAIDLRADKITSKSSHLIVPDDPGFELQFNLPEFDLGLSADVIVARFSQNTGKSSSQLSPLNRLSSQEGFQSMIGGIDIPASSENGSFYLQLPFGRDSMGSQRIGEGRFDQRGEEGAVPAFDDWGIEIDADGNVVPAVEEPELPPLPPLLPQPSHANAGRAQGDHHTRDADGDISMDLGELGRPKAAPQPAAPLALPHTPTRDNPGPEAARAPVRRRKARGPALLGPDRETKISKQEFRSWDAGYVARQEEATRNATKISAGPGQAKKNAWAMIFGRGLMDVGMSAGVSGGIHPLAAQFAGENLAKSFGVDIASDPDGRTNKRSSGEAFGQEKDEERRTRPRVDDGEHVGRGTGRREDEPQTLDQEVEVGREPGSALSDMPSLVPWNRPPSIAAGSSVHGSAKAAASIHGARHVSASPLHGRGGNTLHEIERLSDGPGLGSDDLDQLSPTILRGDHQDSQLA